MRDRIVNEYFEWMFELVSDKDYIGKSSYRKLLMYLHSTAFRHLSFVPNDNNRAEDGKNLRDRFAYEQGYVNVFEYLDGPCSVLEMMIALAIKCEEHIMNDPDIGNRTAKWFWDMIRSMGLYSMNDKAYSKAYTTKIVSDFLNREYRYDGKGGLFTITDCPYDMRDVEIWYQMCWYLNTIL